MTYDEIDRVAATRQASLRANADALSMMKRQEADRRKAERRALAGRYKGGARVARDDRREFVRRLLDALHRS